MGLKAFNRTGQEETTTAVLRPTVSPEVQRRNVILVIVAAVILVVMLGIAFQFSHLSFIPQGEVSHGIGDHPSGDPDHPQ